MIIVVDPRSLVRPSIATNALQAPTFGAGGAWCSLSLGMDLVLDLPHQHVRYDLLEVFVVHESSKNLLILIHAINE